MDGLAAGVYAIRVELGDLDDDPCVLAETRASVVVGERTFVTLNVELAQPVGFVPFAGMLELPKEWGLAAFTLAFERVGRNIDGSRTRFHLRGDDMESRGGLLLWTAPDSPPGLYEVELEALAFATLIELPEGGSTRAHVAVRPPCAVTVRCVDADTGAVATDVALHWCVDASEVGGRRDRAADWDAENELWHFRAPVGRILVSPYSQEYDASPTAHAVQSGSNEIVLRLSRVCTLVPVLRCDDVLIPWGDDFGVPTLEPLEGQRPGRTGTYLGVSQMGVMIHAKPGLYRLVVAPIDGYEPVPDEIVRLERGKVIEHVIELMRSPR